VGDKDREPVPALVQRVSEGRFVRGSLPAGYYWSANGDERLGLGRLINEHLTDTRQGENKKFPLADLVRQSVYSRLAGYEDLNDAVR
jgi:hypothetical protein